MWNNMIEPNKQILGVDLWEYFSTGTLEKAFGPFAHSFRVCVDQKVKSLFIRVLERQGDLFALFAFSQDGVGRHSFSIIRA